MIYTVTLNPSLDYTLAPSHFIEGTTNRSTHEHLCFGGKGLNVSAMLHNLQLPSVALGFSAGFVGDEIEKSAREFGIGVRFIRLRNQCSRINVKIKTTVETELNACGPHITDEAFLMLMEQLSVLTCDDILVLSGNIPPPLLQNTYQTIIKSLPKEMMTVVDCTGEALLCTLPLCPFLIKPNLQELEAIFNTTLSSLDEIIFYGKKLQAMGAKNVLVSLGDHGGVLLAQNQDVFYAPAPKGIVVGSVGCGDAMVAGFLTGYLPQKNIEEGFLTAIASGSACAFSSSFASKETVDALQKTLSNPQKIC